MMGNPGREAALLQNIDTDAEAHTPAPCGTCRKLADARATIERLTNERDRWHRAAMDAGVIVCDGGELAMPEEIAQYAFMQRDAAIAERDALAAAAKRVLSILEAVRYTAGLTGTQIERTQALRAALAKIGGKTNG